MNRETQNEKRALNIVWTAAGDYSLKPMFLAYCRDGTPDIYLNTVIGLVCKWYDQNMIDRFFDSLGTGQRELYEGIFWLGLEHAAYEKEVQVRPALEELRSEYASVNLREGRDLTSNSLLDLLQYGRFCEILGKKAELPGRWRTLLTQLSYSSSMTSRQMIERTRVIYQTYFQYIPRSHKKREAGHFLQRVLPAFFSLGKVHSGFVRVGASADKEAPLAASAGGFLKHMGYLFEFFRAKDYSSARDYVEACFGTDIHSPRIAKQIEQDLCTGNHIGLHLLFTRGDLCLLYTS